MQSCSVYNCHETDNLTDYHYPYPLPDAKQEMTLCPDHLELFQHLAAESGRIREEFPEFFGDD